MTLQRRLLLVYLAVVFLSLATVGVAVFEIRRSRQIIREMQGWNGIVLNVEKLKAGAPGEVDLPSLIAQQYVYLAEYVGTLGGEPDYLDLREVREALNGIQIEYSRWRESPPEKRPDYAAVVGRQIGRLANVLEWERSKLDREASERDVRAQLLFLVVSVLTVLHVAITGELARCWLIRPLERLNRQVDALAHDQPAPEPLLTSPSELANLARALDHARSSLQLLRQRLIEAERLTTIGQLAAQLAHNLRNPLASIRAMAQLTGRQERDTAETGQRMAEIMASVDRMDQWITGLMEVARDHPTMVRVMDVVPTLYRVRDAVKSDLSAKEVRLTLTVPTEGLSCAHDPATLEHALLAMVVNAIEASPLGGEIELRAEQGTARPQNGAVERRDSNIKVCRISVYDRGIGLPMDQPEKVFDFSYSTKQKGMGLGLALARQALQRQGGVAHAENNPEGGAHVFVELPLEWQPGKQ